MINANVAMIVEEVKNKYKTIYKKYGFGEEHSKRIKEELVFIVKHDSLVKDVVYFIDNRVTGGVKNIPNSLVFFTLGVTDMLPDIEKDFCFRFVVDTKNSRISAPDIDIDFEHREAILEHLCDIYGRDKVALIGTSIGFKPKAAVQFAAKALDITGTANKEDRRFSSENTQEGIRLSKIMPNLPGVNLKQWLGEDADFKPPQKCKEPMRLLKAEVDRYPDVFETAKRLEGIFKSYGTHAAGVVISFNPIVDDVPLHYARVKDDGGFDIDNDFDDGSEPLNLMTTQYNMEEVESLGLLKFDFLQLNNLRQMRMVEELVKEKEGYLPFDLDKLETNDEEVFKLINSKNPTKLEGLFQISGKAFAGQDFQRKDWDTGELKYNKDGTPKMNHRKGVIEVIGCKDFNDIVAPNALGRPGPLNCDMHTKYAEAKKYPEDIEYSHPALESILKNSYGQMCLCGDTEIYDRKRNIVRSIKYFSGKKVDIQSQDKNGENIICKDREVVYNGEKECIKLIFDDGSFVVCTKDHKILSENGMIKAESSLDKYMCFVKKIDINKKKGFIENIFIKNNSLKYEKNSKILSKIKDKKENFNNTYDRDKFIDNITEEYSGFSFRQIEKKTGIGRYHFNRNKKGRIREETICFSDYFRDKYIDKNRRMKKVINIECAGIKDVYDIINCGEMKMFSLFNGLLVSNCYQEQLTKMAQVLAGFSYGEADMLRKACAKKKKGYLEKIKPKFYNGCRKNKVSEKVINEMWDIAVEFGQYAFNLSHCLSEDTILYDKRENKNILIRDIKEGMIFDSYLDGNVIEDEVSELIYTGNQEVYEVLIGNGIKIECTMNHKFLCVDEKYYTLKEIMEGDLYIFCINSTLTQNIKKSKIVSIKNIGEKPTYNIGMKSKQHNYLIKDKDNDNYIVSKNSTAYGYITYQTAWLKTKYPTEFICATLTGAAQKDDIKFQRILNNFKKEYKNLEVLLPSINGSKKWFVPSGVKKLQIISPFMSLKGIGGSVSDHIVENQPYAGMEHFLTKVDRGMVDSRTIDILKMSKVFREFSEDINVIQRDIKRYEESMRNNKVSKPKSNVSSKTLF